MYCIFCGNTLSEIKGHLICTFCGGHFVKQGDIYIHSKFDGSISARRFIDELMEHEEEDNDDKDN